MENDMEFDDDYNNGNENAVAPPGTALDTATRLLAQYDRSGVLEVDLLQLADANPEDATQVMTNYTKLYDTLCLQTKQPRLKVRITHWLETNTPLNTDCLETLVTLRGVLVKRSELRVIKTTAIYRCKDCDTEMARTTNVHEWNPTFDRISVCSKCHSSSVVHCPQRDVYSNFFEIGISPIVHSSTFSPLGSTRNTELILGIITSSTCGDIDTLVLGRTVRITGIVRIRSGAVGDGQRMSFPVIVDAVCFDVIINQKLAADSDSEQLPAIVLDRMKEQQNEFALLWTLVSSFAPSVNRCYWVKLALLLMIVGCDAAGESDSSNRVRSNSHILVVNGHDQRLNSMIDSVRDLIQTQSVSAINTTAAGLSITITSSKTTSAGALILAGNGACIIRDLQSLSKEAMAVLSQAMESQEFSFIKGGVKQQINTRCVVLATAAMKRGNMTLLTKTLGGALVSRFDLVINCSEKQSMDYDQLKAFVAPASLPDGTLTTEELRHTLAAARNFKCTTIQPLAERILVALNAYWDRRLPQAETFGGIPACNTRRFESLVRMAKAHAKLLLHPAVTGFDAVDVAAMVMALEQPLDLASNNYPSASSDQSMLEFVRQTGVQLGLDL